MHYRSDSRPCEMSVNALAAIQVKEDRCSSYGFRFVDSQIVSCYCTHGFNIHLKLLHYTAS